MQIQQDVSDKKPEPAAKPAPAPIRGELTLDDLVAVTGGITVSIIANGRYNPRGQKTRFGFR
jgi:hypothetical protein